MGVMNIDSFGCLLCQESRPDVFRNLYKKGWDGVIGMEHGISIGGREGEKRLIEPYREVDDFEV